MADYDSLPSVASQSIAIVGAIPLTVGAALVAPGRSIYVLATVAGTAVFKLANGSSLSVDIGVGGQMLPFAVMGVTSSTATATFSNLI